MQMDELPAAINVDPSPDEATALQSNPARLAEWYVFPQLVETKIKAPPGEATNTLPSADQATGE
jgi:hypothetical protein